MIGYRSLLLIACYLLTCQLSHATESAKKPNVVLIMADDMGYECLGANGSKFYRTPNLDRLAAGGMRFEHCYSQPICTPSRNQIMTGRYNSRNYVKFGLLHPKEVTFGNVMKAAGYATCIAGKWQLQGGLTGPNKFGFDEYCLWQLTRRPTPGVEVNGETVDYKNGEYGPDIVSDYLVDFIERKKDEPFFVYYPMILPHWPFQPTPDSDDWDPTETKEWPRKKWDRPHFSDMVSYADKMVGKIDKALADAGVRENTLLIFTCDNGTYTGITSPFKGQQLTGGKGSTPNAGTHVPLVASWPGTPRDWVFCWYERNGKRDGSVKRYARNQDYKLYHDGRFYNIPSDELEKRKLKPDEIDTSAKATQARLRAVIDEIYADEKDFRYKKEAANKKKKKR